MSKVYGLWVDKMLKSREEAKSLRELLSFSKKEEKDPLLDYLLGFKDRMGHAKELLTDDALTAFLLCDLAGESAHCGYHAVHQLVPRIRHSGGRSDCQWSYSEGTNRGGFR